MNKDDSITLLLQTRFGFDSFRPGQENVVRTLLTGKSAAAIFPTGAGKSICYQLPALQLPALTLVVSPLLALMQDQLDFLHSKGIPAANIDSSQTREQSSDVMSGVREGRIKILMISVERLNNERFRQFLSQVSISLLVVDEAHCISEWGHNFRPDYLKLPLYRHDFKIPQTLLLTATATEQVIDDMGRKFGIDQGNITLTGFYRPNLNLMVQGVKSNQKVEVLAQWLRGRVDQSGIVYVTLQRTAEELSEALRACDIPAQAYHAGMDSALRQRIQQRFMASNKGVIVATIAFGMGIDKSNIRFVAHYDLPKSIENYAQETGRAGRDGLSSDCLVLANRDTLNVLENFVYGDTPELQSIRYVLNEIVQTAANGQWETVLNNLSNQSNIRPLSLKTLLVYLELHNLIKPSHSYFAEYKYKLCLPEQELLAQFEGERQDFVRALFETSCMARVWGSFDFDALNCVYPSDRSRVISALDYMDQQGMIELQTKQMTQVYRVLETNFDIQQVSQELFERFTSKEQSEIKRIHQLMSFFESDQCLSRQLALYFSDHQAPEQCGHCSVCAGQVAGFPVAPENPPLSGMDFTVLSREICGKLGEMATPVLISRFLCGLSTPVFSRLKLRSLKGFASLENYRFSEVKNWVEQQGVPGPSKSG